MPADDHSPERTARPAYPPPDGAAASRLGRLAGAMVRRRRSVLAAWLVAVVATTLLGAWLGGDMRADYATPGSESAAAADLIAERFDGASGESIDVVWSAEAGAGAPAVRARIDRLVEDAAGLAGIGGPSPARIAPGGDVGLIRLDLTAPSWEVPPETPDALLQAARRAEGDGLRIALGGTVIEDAEEGGSPEAVGLVAAIVVLLVGFGAVVAAGLPIAAALVGLGVSSGLIAIAARAFEVPEWAPAIAALIGIGVGIDYTLLMLTRFRDALAAGRPTAAAAAEATATAGLSVLIAGGTVIVSLAGLFLMGVPFMDGVAVAAGLAVAVVMAAAITLVPALLGLLGPRVNALRLPRRDRARRGGPSPAMRWARWVQRHPAAAAAGSLALLVALALPAADLRLGFPDAGTNPAGSTSRVAYDLVAEGFSPGANGPLLLVADIDGPADARAMRAITARLANEPGVARAEDPVLNAAGDAALAVVTPASSPQSAATAELVERLRDHVLPAAAPDVLVGGSTAAFVDQAGFVSGRLPLFIAVVVGLSLLVLLVALRAPLLALKAAALNLLSVGAAYGVVALAAAGGTLGGFLGLDGDTPVAPFIPVIMFALLFGLSMDYEVFLLSRVREEYLRSGDSAEAVAQGLARTARVITAAAAIMVVVFLAFVTADEAFLRLMGLGMAAAILVDATVIRMVLVPAAMRLLGRAAWWTPSWLGGAPPAAEVPWRGEAR